MSDNNFAFQCEECGGLGMVEILESATFETIRPLWRCSCCRNVFPIVETLEDGTEQKYCIEVREGVICRHEVDYDEDVVQYPGEMTCACDYCTTIYSRQDGSPEYDGNDGQIENEMDIGICFIDSGSDIN